MNRNKWIWIILLIFVLAGLIGGYLYFTNTNQDNSKKNNNENNYEASKTSTSKETNSSKNTNEVRVPSTEPQYVEEVISTFSTKIYTNDPARQHNINITCGTLDNTTVKNGETFSFCNTVGRSTKEKGYQEADIFDNKGNKKKGLGGRKLPIKYYSL